MKAAIKLLIWNNVKCYNSYAIPIIIRHLEGYNSFFLSYLTYTSVKFLLKNFYEKMHVLVREITQTCLFVCESESLF